MSYTVEEEAWIKQHYQNEWQFLRKHGLSMHKDEDREEGRAIARALMTSDDDDDDDNYMKASSSNPGVRREQVSSEPYTEEEKLWLRRLAFFDEASFLKQNGLSIEKAEDREEGKAKFRKFLARSGVSKGIVVVT